ncbi:tocopherol cyclase family protein [Clostridium sp. C105KSO13]|uniref:tocopherol cyclase family protein n=1 Tax=Clostridium sp. C105KSO13 TaxID=1776045 RepID=UPI000740863A|nr:tocopherol cyclase family protein [Clostridium sp. C105KSO13]CUX38800.1 hypothetical protein BN3456_01925 [Clostridium sp. C105KSO13]
MQTRYFHGDKKHSPYFEGWYLKHQIEEKTIAFIPAVHADKNGKWSASLQVLLSDGKNDGAWYLPWPTKECKVERNKFRVQLGENIFSEKGISIDIENEKLSVHGKVAYSGFQKIRGDIMGFFRFLPLMQCSHGVISMCHSLKGNLKINGEIIKFTGGKGYIETDWGRSFPRDYLWTQCWFGDKNSIMVSAADVPIMRKSFRGCICAIHYNRKEYRLGTYYGARIPVYGDGRIALKEGRKLLKVTRLDEHPFKLRAPALGSMERMIKESPICRVRYEFWVGKKKLIDIISGQASYEQVL